MCVSPLGKTPIFPQTHKTRKDIKMPNLNKTLIKYSGKIGFLPNGLMLIKGKLTAPIYV
jgi:hypothetical protein